MAKVCCKLVNFFSTLTEELSDVRSCKPEQRFAIERQVVRMRKRALLGKGGLTKEAVRSFEQTNLLVGNSIINLDPYVLHNARLFISEAFERYNRRFDEDLIQIPFDPRRLDDLWRFGPGASNGIWGKHTAEKIFLPMSCTLLAKPLVLRIRKRCPYFVIFDDQNQNDGTLTVSGSRLSTVPKNEDVERTIAIEPSGNMVLQLAAGEYIANVLRSIGLNIQEQQPKNKALAHRGSIDGSLATIDMKSASDMISIELVRQLFPSSWFDHFMRIRSYEVTLPSKRVITMNMMSTMGNGFTFPMMTLIFTALVYANRLKHGGRPNWIDWGVTGVYGDDIIVPVNEYDTLVNILESCGLIINRDKSYSTGSFRESCGGDYFEGHDVTPFYVKSLSSDSEVYIALNKVYEWCAKVGKLLPLTILYLKSLLVGKVRFVPEWYGDDAGFRTTLVERKFTYLKPATPQKRTRYPLFDVMLAAGGYVNSRDSDVVYTPRPFKTRYVVRKSRLPKGYLTGYDPLSRTAPVSAYITSHTDLLAL